jgi:hypothetical protein
VTVIETAQELLKRATVDSLEPDLYFAEIPGLPGPWACRAAFEEVLSEWLVARAETPAETVFMLPDGDDDDLVEGPVMERLLHMLGISPEEWEAAGDDDEDIEGSL